MSQIKYIVQHEGALQKESLAKLNNSFDNFPWLLDTSSVTSSSVSCASFKVQGSFSLCQIKFSFAFCTLSVDDTAGTAIVLLTDKSAGNEVGVVEQCRHTCKQHQKVLLPLETDAQRKLLNRTLASGAHLLVTDAREKINTFGKQLLGKPFGKPISELNVAYRYHGQPAPSALQGLVEEEVHCIGRHFWRLYSYFCDAPKRSFHKQEVNCFCTLEGRRSARLLREIR